MRAATAGSGLIVGTYHQLSAKHLPAYLDEVVFRFNNRENPWSSETRCLGCSTKSRCATDASLRRLLSGVVLSVRQFRDERHALPTNPLRVRIWSIGMQPSDMRAAFGGRYRAIALALEAAD